MQQTIVDEFPVEDLRVEIVWIDVLAADGAKAAHKASPLISPDRRVRHYHDPQQRSGDAIAASLGWDDLAWDIYLFYEPGVEWKEQPPKPRFFFHQLTAHAQDGHFAIRQDLIDRLGESLAAMGDQTPAAATTEEGGERP